MTRGVTRFLLALALAVPLGWLCWQIGRSIGSSQPTPRSFRIQGSSMVPTLFGASRAVFCPECRFVWQVELFAGDAESAGLLCGHCGGPLRDRADHDHGAGDQVTIDTIEEIRAAGEPIRPGDLVAIRRGGTVHIKRVVAMPGETIDAQGARLRVDSERLEDRLQHSEIRFPSPWILVDHDARRSESRWSVQNLPATAANPWDRDPMRILRCEESTQPSPWLLYGHRSLDRGKLPSPVWDDYPFNVTLSRKLFVADRLRLRGESLSAMTCEAAFWREEGSVLVVRSFEANSSFVITCFEGEPTEGLPVSPQFPVAIRVVAGRAGLRELMIERLVEYRLRPHDDRGRYPLRLDRDEWFLLGDNVPVSVDSRQWGAISGDQLVGRLRRLDSPRREMVVVLP